MPALSFPRSRPQALPQALPLAPPVARAGLAATATLLATPEQRWLDVEGRRFVLRALGAGDAALLGCLWNDDLSRAARRMRFHAGVGRIGLDRLQACCQLTPARGQAFVLTQLLPGGDKALAEGRWAWTAHAGSAELSVSVADAWQGRGLGRRMVQALLLAAQNAGAQTMQADVLCDNETMQALLRHSGFVRRGKAHAAGLRKEVDDEVGDDTLSFVKDLLPQPRNTVGAMHDAWHMAWSKVVVAQGRRWLAALTTAALVSPPAGSGRFGPGWSRPERSFDVRN